MGFFELGNGCDSCETLDMSPRGVNNMMDAGSAAIASMAMPYGTQNNIAKQYTNTVSAGYATPQGTNYGYISTGNNATTLGVNVQNTPTQAMVMVPATTTTTTNAAGQIVKQVAAPGPVAVVVPAANTAVGSSTGAANNKVEGFTDGSYQMDPRKWIILGLVIFSALALNECCKYFLNKSLQLNDGSPLYYVAYAGVAAILTWAVQTYISKN